MNDATQITIPAALIAVATAIFVGYGFYMAGTAGAGTVLGVVGVQLALGIVIGIIACYITASLMGISFGPLGPACLKLAAIFMFPSAVALFIPYVGGIVALALFFGLLAWLFELEGREIVVCAAVMWVVRTAAVFVANLFLLSAA